MKPRTKTIRETEKVSTVYFPSGTDGKNIKRWIRNRGFSARDEDLAWRRQRLNPEDAFPTLIPAAHCRTVKTTQIQERFVGESEIVGTTLSADDVVALYQLLLVPFEPFRRGALPEMRVKGTRRGVAVISRPCPWFSVPLWALKKSEEWAVCYMAHELAHHANGGMIHGKAMCEVEAALLAPFDIRIEYRGCRARGSNQPWYPHRLVRIYTDETICGRRGAVI